MKKHVTTFLILCFLSILSTACTDTVVDRIKASGDGKSIETAYKVHTIEEEYMLLTHLKIAPLVQKLTIINGEFYDVFSLNNQSIYFKLLKKSNTKTIEI